MANTKAQTKTIDVDRKRRARNRQFKSLLHTQLKKLDETIDANNKVDAEAELKKSLVRIDKSVTKGIIHANKGSRTKSRLVAKVARMA